MSTLLFILCFFRTVHGLPKQPNILLLTTDQQRLDTMGCYGSSFAKSPNIDALAEQGVRYTHSYSASPVCSSARTSWLTGTQVPVHNVWGNGIARYHTSETKKKRRLDAEEIITPLKNAGYFTAAIGKTHYFPVPEYDHLDGHTSNTFKRQANTRAADFFETYLVNQTMLLLDNELNAQILPEQPWFVHLSFISPHPPSNVPVEWQNMYKKADIPKVRHGGPEELAGYPNQLKGMYANFTGKRNMKVFPGGQPNHTWIRRFRRKYYALANYVDHQVGRILRFLYRRGYAENTHIIFTSDHGTNLYDHGIEEKYNFFDPSWRVPLILSGPGLPKGTTQTFAAGVDVPATILAIAQAERPPGLNGFDLIGPLQRGEGTPRTHGVAGSLLQSYAVVTNRWKLSYYLDDERGQLFDLSSDPHELTNLFDNSNYADLKMRLVAALLKWRAGLEPIKWLRENEKQSKAQHPNIQYVMDYTTQLQGTASETRLQTHLAQLQSHREYSFSPQDTHELRAPDQLRTPGQNTRLAQETTRPFQESQNNVHVEPKLSKSDKQKPQRAAKLAIR